jgi:hypothetical protein
MIVVVIAAPARLIAWLLVVACTPLDYEEAGRLIGSHDARSSRQLTRVHNLLPSERKPDAFSLSVSSAVLRLSIDIDQ